MAMSKGKKSTSYSTSMGNSGMHTAHNGGQCASDCKMNSKMPHTSKAQSAPVKGKGGKGY